MSVLYYGGTLVFDERLSVGALTSFVLYAAYTAISINGLSNFYTELNKGIGSAHRIWEILDRKYAISLDEGIYPGTKPVGKVSFQNICFCFPSRPNNFVLNNFNLELEPGTTTAVVGRSGSGKTTIATLLLRLYDPNEGCIVLDGHKLSELNPTWLRSHIGAVTQVNFMDELNVNWNKNRPYRNQFCLVARLERIYCTALILELQLAKNSFKRFCKTRALVSLWLLYLMDWTLLLDSEE